MVKLMRMLAFIALVSLVSLLLSFFFLPGCNPSGDTTITLEDGDSYHFLTRKKGRYSGGDFYLSSQATRFYANNVGQRGLQDLGSLGNTPLSDVTIPETGYTRFGVAVIVGHTYVSLAREGEEGHYIVFRVKQAVSNEHVTLEYYYKPPVAPPSADTTWLWFLILIPVIGLAAWLVLRRRAAVGTAETSVTLPESGTEPEPAISTFETSTPSKTASAVCSKCGSTNRPNASFCAHCGAALKVAGTCTKCGFLNRPGAAFCGRCGKSLKGVP